MSIYQPFYYLLSLEQNDFITNCNYYLDEFQLFIVQEYDLFLATPSIKELDMREV